MPGHLPKALGATRSFRARLRTPLPQASLQELHEDQAPTETSHMFQRAAPLEITGACTAPLVCSAINPFQGQIYLLCRCVSFKAVPENIFHPVCLYSGSSPVQRYNTLSVCGWNLFLLSVKDRLVSQA